MEGSDTDISSSSDAVEEMYSLHHPNNLQPYDFELEVVATVDNAALCENC